MSFINNSNFYKYYWHFIFVSKVTDTFEDLIKIYLYHWKLEFNFSKDLCEVSLKTSVQIFKNIWSTLFVDGIFKFFIKQKVNFSSFNIFVKLTWLPEVKFDDFSELFFFSKKLKNNPTSLDNNILLLPSSYKYLYLNEKEIILPNFKESLKTSLYWSLSPFFNFNLLHRNLIFFRFINIQELYTLYNIILESIIPSLNIIFSFIDVLLYDSVQFINLHWGKELKYFVEKYFYNEVFKKIFCKNIFLNKKINCNFFLIWERIFIYRFYKFYKFINTQTLNNLTDQSWLFWFSPLKSVIIKKITQTVVKNMFLLKHILNNCLRNFLYIYKYLGYEGIEAKFLWFNYNIVYSLDFSLSKRIVFFDFYYFFNNMLNHLEKIIDKKNFFYRLFFLNGLENIKCIKRFFNTMALKGLVTLTPSRPSYSILPFNFLKLKDSELVNFFKFNVDFEQLWINFIMKQFLNSKLFSIYSKIKKLLILNFLLIYYKNFLVKFFYCYFKFFLKSWNFDVLTQNLIFFDKNMFAIHYSMCNLFLYICYMNLVRNNYFIKNNFIKSYTWNYNLSINININQISWVSLSEIKENNLYLNILLQNFFKPKKWINWTFKNYRLLTYNITEEFSFELFNFLLNQDNFFFKNYSIIIFFSNFFFHNWFYRNYCQNNSYRISYEMFDLIEDLKPQESNDNYFLEFSETCSDLSVNQTLNNLKKDKYFWFKLARVELDLKLSNEYRCLAPKNYYFFIFFFRFFLNTKTRKNVYI